MVNAEALFNAVEIQKKAVGLPVGRAPRVIQMVKKWRSAEISNERLLQLSHYVGIGRSSDEATGKIFLHTGSTKVGVTAQAIEELRSTGDKDIVRWLKRVDDRLLALVREACPPLFILANPILTSGHIPDGNHRALAAALLILQGEKVKIPIYEGRLSPHAYLAINLLYMLVGFKNSPETTVKLMKQRAIDCRTE